jgi:gamma-glutamyltranspeptidase/glutathione hydrolase
MNGRCIIRWTPLILAVLLAACAPQTHRETATDSVIPATWDFARVPPPVTGTNGMVASDQPLASEAGVQVMRQGGNAIDAAVATAFALAVVLPEAGNIGGGGFMVVRMADGTSAALDFREKAPAAASRNMYLDANGNATDRSIIGHLAAGVPGSVAGLYEAHKRFGTLPWHAVVEPAIRLAADGFIVTKDLAYNVSADSSRMARFPGSAALFLPGGKPLPAGARWRNPDLAASLQRIATEGPRGFYEGKTADLIIEEMHRGNGIITREDLATYTAVWRAPITTDYRGHTIISMPPPSSGGTTIALMAHMLERHDIRGTGWHSPEGIHLTVEAMRRAFADRNYWFGDPDFVRVPVDRLMSQDYADLRGSTIDPVKATPSAAVSHGPAGPSTESMHTTHYSVADGAGNMVAVTTTVNLGFGSAVTVTGAGFLLNNEMDDFASKPGTPNVFGLVQGEANAIAPGKRILSSMSPTIVLDPDGEPLLITGASGGPRIITAVFQVITNVVDHRMDITAAVMAPRFHHQHLPDTILLENNGFAEDRIAALHSLGHATKAVRHLALAPSILRTNGVWRGSADPRTGGLAAGY